MAANKNGCAYGMVSRTMISNLKDDMNDIKIGISEIKTENKTMFNHLSSRLPWWASILMTGLVSLCVGLIVRGVYTG